jgi:hypothetical protein
MTVTTRLEITRAAAVARNLGIQRAMYHYGYNSIIDFSGDFMKR